jgi:hypothetical protein
MLFATAMNADKVRTIEPPLDQHLGVPPEIGENNDFPPAPPPRLNSRCPCDLQKLEILLDAVENFVCNANLCRVRDVNDVRNRHVLYVQRDREEDFNRIDRL